MALSTLQMASTAITPGLAGISAYFPELSSSLVQMLLSLPALFVVPFALFSGSIVTVLSKKTLLIMGVILVGIGGLAPIFMNNFTWILIMRIVLGIGVGLIMPIAPSVLTDYLSGYELDSAMGLYGSFACFGGIFNSLIGGMLADIGWQYNLLVYLTCIPVLIITLLYLPDDGKVRQEMKKEKIRIEPVVFYIAFICLLFTTAKFAFTMNISMFVSEEQLGDATLTGMLSSVYTAGGFIAGLIFGRLAKLCKKYTLGIGMLFAATGMFMVFITHNTIILFAGAFLLGTALSVVNPRFNVMISEVASPKSLALSLAVLMATMNLGQFAAPIVFNTLGELTGFTTKRSQFLLASIALLALGVGSLILNYFRNRKINNGVGTVEEINPEKTGF
jgi:MFS family permease